MPHGFNWESKCGHIERLMHTRDAVRGAGYGTIAYYYKPKAGAAVPTWKSVNTDSDSFNSSDLKKISDLKNCIPNSIIAEFEKKYIIWKNTWDNPRIAISSNAYDYAKSEEYDELLKYCEKHGNVVLPLIIEKLAENGDIVVVNLFRDLIYEGDEDFCEFIDDKNFSGLYSNLVVYSRNLMENELLNCENIINN